MRIKWGLKGFSLNAVSNGAMVVVCYGYPPSAYNQNIYPTFPISTLQGLPQSATAIPDVVE